jgi:Alpha-kinase family
MATGKRDCKFRAIDTAHLQVTDLNNAAYSSNQVFKQFKTPSDVTYARGAMFPYQRQIEESTVARFLADKFNKECVFNGREGLLEIKVATARVVKTSNGQIYNMERLLTGKFTKWVNNDGTWNEDVFECGVAEKTLLRFMLFSYEKTQGYMLVTDLQGTKAEPSPPGPVWKDPKQPGYTLTDPCVLCVDRARFGDAEFGNLGPDFMQRNLDRCCRLLRVTAPIVEEE